MIRPPNCWSHFALLALICCAGVVTRGYRLGAKSLWTDELFTWYIARQPLSTWRANLPSDIPPGHLLPVRLALRIHPSDAAMRIPSAVSGVLGLGALYALVRRLRGPQHGLAAAVLLLFSPAHLYHAQDARMYAHLFLIVTLATLCLLRIRDGGGLGWWMAYTLLGVLGMYVTYVTVFVFPAHGLFLAADRLAQTRAPAGTLRAWLPIIAWCGVLLLIAVALLPWSGPLLRFLRETTGAAQPEPTASFGAEAFRRVLVYLAFSPRTWVVEWTLAFVGLVAVWRRERGLGSLALGGMVFPFLVLFLARSGRELAPRYFFFLLPLFVWLLVEGLDELVRLLARLDHGAPRRAAFTVSLLCAGWLAGAGGPVLYRYYTTEKMNWCDAVAFLRDQVEPGDLVLTGVHYASLGLARYAPAGLGQDVKVLHGLYDPKRLIAVLKRYPGRVWYITGAWPAIPPDVRDKLLLGLTRRVRVFPALEPYGEIHVLCRWSPGQPSPLSYHP